MLRYLVISLLLLYAQFSFAQLVINELDCDTPGVDDKEFLEIRSQTPHFPLNGYIVVFFNGSSSGGNRSYFNIDLNGYSTDINGLLLIGSTNVSPVPQLLISENVIQNGADGVGIYHAAWTDFPEGTLANDKDLIDALVYGTNDPEVASLMALLNVDQQINEGLNGKKDTESIQRDNDGGYFIAAPTPRQLNDGTGVVLNGISILVSDKFPNEGDLLDITITSETDLEFEQSFEFSLINGSFDSLDYSGTTSVTIAQGMHSGSTVIQILDDQADEGDEEMVIRLLDFPETFLALNDNLTIRVVDNDFTMAPWGRPTQPSYDKVEGTQPADYYDRLIGKSGDSLRQAIQNIIADPTIVRAQTYADIIEILKIADQDPANSNQVWLVYSEQGKAKLDFQTGSDNTGKWNREHTYPRSRGGFNSIEADEVADGIEVYWNTNADSLRHANSDGHGLRAVDGIENSHRGNQHYGQYNGPDGNLGSFKGDVARSVLYMSLRYNGLEVVDGFPELPGQLGDLSTILDWHRHDPPDDYEMNRNNMVYEWQFNRNPLIDLPDLVEYLWGTKKGEVWTDQVNNLNIQDPKIVIYPNPANDHLYIENIRKDARLSVLSPTGFVQEMFIRDTKARVELDLAPGIYFLQLTEAGKSVIRKLIVQ